MFFCRDSTQFSPLATAVRCEVTAPKIWHAGRGRWAPRQVTILALFPLFLQPCSHSYLTEFLEIGGAWTPLEILGLNHVKEEDKRESVKLLLLTGDTGRAYKEPIRESCGTQPVHCALSWFRQGCSSWPLAPGAACCTEPFPSLCLLMADPAVLLWMEGVQSPSYCWEVVFHPLYFLTSSFSSQSFWYNIAALLVPLSPVKTTKQFPSLPAAFTYCKLSQSSSLGWESFVACVF